jgi:hypothetical protein
MEAYSCNFSGSKFDLKFLDDGTITLSNKFQSFPCKKGYEYFPGTELELKTLICKGKFKDTTYYMTEMDEETIILSKGFVFSNDVTCKKF